MSSMQHASARLCLVITETGADGQKAREPVPRIGIINGVGLDWRGASSPFVLRKHIIYIPLYFLGTDSVEDTSHGVMT
jgi:hypothetical protein